MAKNDRGMKKNPNTSISVPCVVQLKDGTPQLVSTIEDMPAGNEIARVVLNDYSNRNGRRPNWPEVNIHSDKMDSFIETVLAAKISKVEGQKLILQTGGSVSVTKEFMARYRPNAGTWLVQRGSGRDTLFNIVPDARFKRRYEKKDGGKKANANGASNQILKKGIDHVKAIVKDNPGMSADDVMKKAAGDTLSHKGQGGMSIDFSPGKVLKDQLDHYAYSEFIQALVAAANVDKAPQPDGNVSPEEKTEEPQIGGPCDFAITLAVKSYAAEALENYEVDDSVIVSDLVDQVLSHLSAVNEVDIDGTPISLFAWYKGLEENSQEMIARLGLAATMEKEKINAMMAQLTIDVIKSFDDDVAGSLGSFDAIETHLENIPFVPAKSGPAMAIHSASYSSNFQRLPEAEKWHLFNELREKASLTQ